MKGDAARIAAALAFLCTLAAVLVYVLGPVPARPLPLYRI